MEYNTDLFVEHLRGMVQIPTVSSADPEKMDTPAFLKLHDYLEKTYPLVHKAMTKEVVGRAGLLYHMKGTGKSKSLPLMLIAHLDVVPEGDLSLWKHPPFSGEVADGFVWGRGSTDSKCNIQAYMDALELLLADGFKPDYDLYFGFGYNEEIMGGPEPAAQLIADVLKKRGVQLGCLIDECGGIQKTADGKKYGFIYTCEKGYADFEFLKQDSGGHSAIPTPHSALGEVCKAACILEDNPMPVKLTDIAVQQLEASAPFLTDPEIAKLCSDVRGNWDKLRPLLEADKIHNALIRTTTAVTMAQGSQQANVMPEKAWIIANNRMLPGQTLDDLWEHFRNILPETISIRLVKGSNPPPVQSVDTPAYKLIESIVREQHNVPLIPCMLYGGTDSRYYCDLCPSRSVYRMTGLQWDPRWDGISHKVNERIPCDVLADNVDFYVRLLQRYGE